MNTQDRYISFSNSGFGKFITGAVGLPRPTPLKRAEDSGRNMIGPALLETGPNARLEPEIQKILENSDIKIYQRNNYNRNENGPAGALIFDATGITKTEELATLYEFYHNTIRASGRCCRALVLASLPETEETPQNRIIQRSLEGFIRSLGKEMRHGSTAQLIYVGPGVENSLSSTIEFFLSPRSAYVTGQVIRLKKAGAQTTVEDSNKPQSGRIALVTGASRGIGAAISETLARDGAHVIGLDIPPLKDDLDKLMKQIGGSSLTVDITSEEAIEQIINDAKARGGYDIIVHNAGITRDKTIANMDADRWNSVIAVNLTAPMKITEAMLEQGAIKDNGRIVCLSSVNGIAGSNGQTNYGLTKAGIIGMVESIAPMLENGMTINAVAPGFIETQMTAAIPFAVREIARRMNSLQQGGLPIDVAETIAWMAHPQSGAVNGCVVRTCGQSIVGA